MCIHKPEWPIFLAVFIILLNTACNQMDTILPSAGTYQMDVLNGGFSLNEYSVIAAGDTIHPYFVNPVVDDPDLRGLVLYVEDDSGKVLGRRILYSSDADPAPSVQSEGDQPPDGDLVLEEETGDAAEAAETGGAAQITAVFPGDDINIPVKNFAKALPPFPLPEGLEVGAYSLIFEIRGEHTVLSRMTQPFYYIGDRKFAAGEIRHYLPGFYGNSHLVPPGLTVMLEVQVDYGEDLDPYVIWYNGKNRIGEGFAAAGAVRLLWTAPLRSGFHTVRAELFPSRPRAGQKGKIKEFSLPVSQKNETDSSPAVGDYLYRYRFAGNLLGIEAGKALNPLPGTKVSPSWYPVEQIYGLALDDGEGYEVPVYYLDISENNGGWLGFFVRIFPLKDGGIFSARLGSSLAVDLFLEAGTLFLDLEGQGEVSRTSKVLPESGRAVFTGVFVTVEFDESRAGASLALGALDEAGDSWPGMDYEAKNEESLALSEWAEISLSRPLSGELRSWIGTAPGESVRPERGTEIREDSPVSGSPEKAAGSAPPVLVLDDFAAIFRGRQDPTAVADPTGPAEDPLEAVLDEDPEAGVTDPVEDPAKVLDEAAGADATDPVEDPAEALDENAGTGDSTVPLFSAAG
jgi:hypothetical protein